jgi:hypothetical protein
MKFINNVSLNIYKFGKNELKNIYKLKIKNMPLECGL